MKIRLAGCLVGIDLEADFGCLRNPHNPTVGECGGLDEYMRHRQSAWDYDLPENWQEVATKRYTALLRRIAEKQLAWAARPGVKAAHAEAAKLASAKNVAVDSISESPADLDDVRLGQVGSMYGAMVYLPVQPDYSRDSGSWELLMEAAKQIKAMAEKLNAEADQQGIAII